MKPNKFDLIYDEVTASENEQKLSEGAIQNKIDAIVSSKKNEEKVPQAREISAVIKGSDVVRLKYQNNCRDYQSLDLLDAYKIFASVDDSVEMIKARTEILLYIGDSEEDVIFTNRMRTVINMISILKKGIIDGEVGTHGNYDFEYNLWNNREFEDEGKRATSTEASLDYLLIDYCKEQVTEPNSCLIKAMIVLTKATDKEFHDSIMDVKHFMDFPPEDADLLDGDDEIKVLELVEIIKRTMD